MINELDVITELKQHTPMLLKSDTWLENKKIELSEELNRLSTDLQAVIDVQRIKQQLQQTNQAPIRCKESGTEQSVIKILPLKDAMYVLESETEEVKNYQLNILKSDGYEIRSK